MGSIIQQINKDSFRNDAFGRQRTSHPETVFESKHIQDTNPFYWSDNTSGGSSSIALVSGAGIVRLTAGTGSTDFAVRQSRQYINYQPGKSHQIMLSFVMGTAVAGVRRRVGYYDVSNGIFLQVDGTSSPALVLRNQGVDTTVSQDQWNLYQLRSTYNQGIDTVLDLTKAQILFIDFEWLGAGRVRCGFVIDGQIVYVHEFLNANNLATTWMGTPNLPVRYSIANTTGQSGTHTLDHLCTSVISEGGIQKAGRTISIDRSNTTTSITTSLEAIISVRLQATKYMGIVAPESITISAAGGQYYIWKLIRNPTFTGGAAASWVTVANSSVEYDITRDGVVSGGTTVLSGYGVTTNDINFDLGAIIPMGTVRTNTDTIVSQDEYVLAAQTVAAANVFMASIRLREL